MAARFRVKGNVGRASFNKVADDAIDRFHHQMHIDGRGHAVFAQRLADHGANRQVRHIVVVHHIEVNDVGASGEHGIDFGAKAGKVRRKDGRGYLVVAFHGKQVHWAQYAAPLYRIVTGDQHLPQKIHQFAANSGDLEAKLDKLGKLRQNHRQFE